MLSARDSGETAAFEGETLNRGPRFHGPGHGMGPMELLEELDLTDQQKSTIEDIMTSYRDVTSDLRNSIREARENFFDLGLEEEFNEDNIRRAFQSVAAAEEELAVTMARIYSEIKEVLTSEQLELLKEIIAARKEEIASFHSSNLLDEAGK